MNEILCSLASIGRWDRKAGTVLLLMCLGMLVPLWAQQENSIEFVRPFVFNLNSHWVVNPFKAVPYRSTFSMDSLLTVRGLFGVRNEGVEEWAEITPGSNVITFYEAMYGKYFKTPFSAPVEWYFKERLARNQMANFPRLMHQSPSERKQIGKRSGITFDVAKTELGQASLTVSGNVSVTGKLVFQDQELIRSTVQEAQTTHFEFDETQHVVVEGKVGDRVGVQLDYNSERDFQWENNIRINYTGTEDEIVQKVEAGNIALSLPSTQFVTFSGSNQGLFGLKSILKLGPVDVTSIASIERTKKQKQEFKGGAQTQGQSIPDYQYRKNQYFFLDRIFRDGGLIVDDNGVQLYNQRGEPLFVPSFYPLKNGKHLIGNVVIDEIEVFKSVGAGGASGTLYGLAYVDPYFNEADSTWQERYPEYVDDTEGSLFQRLVRNRDYVVNEDMGYLRLTAPIQNELLAVSYTLSDSGGTSIIRSVGELSERVTPGDTIHLKMIKPLSRSPSHPTWPLAFKNVYYLGATNIEDEGFELKIEYKNGALGNDEWDKTSGKTFVHLFGLDSLDNNSNPLPDDIIDKQTTSIVNLATGELFFPMLHPFEIDTLSETGRYRGEGNKSEALKAILPDSALMYRSLDDLSIRNESKFEIKVSYQNRSSTVNLGGFMLVEGSEEVYLNKKLLQRDKDYIIDYFTGTVTFLTDDYNKPNAELEVLFEKHELVSFDKKSIVGARAQIDLGAGSFIGGTALFYDQSVINEKIEVGYEPTRNFIWDVNGRYETDVGLLTKAIDKLPLIETSKPSSFKIEGEFAQVLPNPNSVDNPRTGDPDGVAYIDDFEGSKRTTSPSIRRRFWYRSSAPIGFRQKNRSNMFWYNPVSQVSTRDIWPNQQTSALAQNRLTDVLVLDYSRREAHLNTVDPDSNWAGITTSFYSSDFNQSQSKFFEIWLLTRDDTDARLTVDLGLISEDQDGDDVFDTEDKPEAGLVTGNTKLTKDEDIGLDGCEDPFEDGYGGCLKGITYVEALHDTTYADKVYAGADRDTLDPNGDNWVYDPDEAAKEDPTGNAEPYRFVNGTEGNGGFSPPGRVDEGGRYPDTEDINRDGNFDARDDYFTTTFALNPNSPDSIYVGGETAYSNGRPTGWRLYRIPLSEFRRVKNDGNITWDTIKFLRLTVTGVRDHAVIRIAKVELVGNEWQELGIRSDPSQEYAKNDSVFAVTVVNTEDNSDYARSVREIGVQGEYDRINNIRLKEQSLVLKFNDLGPGHEGAAHKNLIELRGKQAQSYLMYRKLKMFIYGKNKEGELPHMWQDSSHVEFLIRFGRGDDYYEVRQPVYEGWDKRNFMSVDLDFLTSLKANRDSATVDIDTIVVENNTTRSYLVHGDPSLSRLQYFIAGVKNTSYDAISGEIWLDELRLSGVRKDVGSAVRLQASIGLADVGSATFSYARRDADFHVLQERLGSGNTSEKLRFDTRLNLNRLFPQSWGLKIPLNMSFTDNLTTPKYLPGTDLLTQDRPPDDVLTKSRQISMNTSFSKTAKSDKWYTRYTIDRLKVNFSGSHGWNSNTQVRERFSKNYSGGSSYGLKFGRNNYISPFGIFRKVPWLGKKVGDTHLYYTPSSIDLSASVSETSTETTPRVGESKSVYNLGLNRMFKVGYTVLDNLTTSYTKNMKSDMDSFRARYLEAVKHLKPGTVTDVTENMSTSFSPAIVGWLRPTFNYTANYRWAKPIGSTQEGANITSQVRFATSLSLSPRTIIESVYSPPGQRSRRPARRGGRGRTSPEKEKEPKKTPKNPALQKLLKVLYDGAGHLNPISVTYSESRSQNAFGVIDSVTIDDKVKIVPGRAPVLYRFGFTDKLGLNRSSEVGVNRGSLHQQRDLSLSSGLSLTRQITTNFSFSDSRARGIDGNKVRTRTRTRDFLPLGLMGSDGLPFVGWNLRWTGVERWPVLRIIARSASFEHAFTGKETRAWKDDVMQSSKYTASYSPLAGLSMTLLKGISASTRYNVMTAIDNRFGGINSTRVKRDRSWTVSSNYAHRGGLRIPVFFFRDFNLENTINFTLTIDFSESITKERNDRLYKLSTTDKRKSWKISPRISYSFSRRVTGGIWYEYRESHSKIVGRKVDRDFGFDVNLSLQG